MRRALRSEIGAASLDDQIPSRNISKPANTGFIGRTGFVHVFPLISRCLTAIHLRRYRNLANWSLTPFALGQVILPEEP